MDILREESQAHFRSYRRIVGGMDLELTAGGREGHCINAFLHIFRIKIVVYTDINALAGPFVGLKVMPTGGVNAKNLEEYLNCKHIVACGGSWMVKGDLIKAGDFQKIEELTREAVELVKEIRSKQ